jgi:RNA polymerase sigma-70 factor (ECF subfamily)
MAYPVVLMADLAQAVQSGDNPPGTGAGPQPSHNHGAAADTDEQSLVAAAKSGDGDAFGQLVDRHGGRLFQLMLQLAAGDQEMAAELVQEAFVRAWERLDRFDGRSAFYTWLYRLGRNRAIDVLARKRPRAMEDEHLEQASRPVDSGAAQAVERQETQAAVQAALAELSDEQRELILLRDFDGCDYAEISERLEVPVGTVKSRLNRARAALRERLSGRMAGGDLA